jgi:predicted transcriptional regulator YdeE
VKNSNGPMGESEMQTIGLILETADHSVPKDLHEKVLEHKPNVFSYSICEMGKKEVEFNHSAEDIPTAEQWNNLRTGQSFKSQKIVTWYGYDKSIKDEEIQPFVLLMDEKKRPLVVAYLDANLEHRKKTTAHEFILAEIGPMVDVYNQIAEGDIVKLMKGLTTDAFRKQVMDKLPNGGTLILHSTDGIAVIGESNQDVEGDWGYCSQVYGWQEPKESPKSPESPKPVKTSFLDSLSARSSGNASAFKSQVVTAETSKDKLKTTTAEIAELAKQSLIGGGGSSSKDGMIFPPAELVKAYTAGDTQAAKQSRKNLAAWYHDRSPKKGFSLDRDIPKWREGCGIPAAGSWTTAESFIGAFKKFNSTGEGVKDTGTHNIPNKQPPTVDEVRKKINDAAETKNNIYNTFMDQEGVKKIYDMKSWDFEALQAKMYYPANDPLKDIKFDQWTMICALSRDDLKLLADQSDWLIDMIYKYAHLALVLLNDNSKLRLEKQKANETTTTTSSSVITPTAEDKEAIATGAPVPRQRRSMF